MSYPDVPSVRHSLSHSPSSVPLDKGFSLNRLGLLSQILSTWSRVIDGRSIHPSKPSTPPGDSSTVNNTANNMQPFWTLLWFWNSFEILTQCSTRRFAPCYVTLTVASSFFGMVSAILPPHWSTMILSVLQVESGQRIQSGNQPAVCWPIYRGILKNFSGWF